MKLINEILIAVVFAGVFVACIEYAQRHPNQAFYGIIIFAIGLFLNRLAYAIRKGKN